MDYRDIYKHWLESTDIDAATRKELEEMAGNDAEIKERFYKELEFGTGGLRGVIGAGINRINSYIVKKTTQGYAEYIKSMGEDACRRGVVIAHDNRRFSIEFSNVTAGVLAANGIKAYVFDSLRPTPELSFAVRYLGAFGGVVITASHNPPEYNGYKLYDERGCQLVPSVNDLIVAEISKIDDPLTVKALTFEEAGDLITVLGADVDEAYYKAVMEISICPDVKKDIKIVYSPQHGTGNVPVRTVLDSAQQRIFDISNGNETKEFRHIRDILHNVYQDLETLQENKGAVTGSKTGFSALDKLRNIRLPL